VEYWSHGQANLTGAARNYARNYRVLSHRFTIYRYYSHTEGPGLSHFLAYIDQSLFLNKEAKKMKKTGTEKSVEPKEPEPSGAGNRHGRWSAGVLE